MVVHVLSGMSHMHGLRINQEGFCSVVVDPNGKIYIFICLHNKVTLPPTALTRTVTHGYQKLNRNGTAEENLSFESSGKRAKVGRRATKEA